MSAGQPVTRRRFLLQAFGSAAAGLAGTWTLSGCRPTAYPDPPLSFLNAKERAALHAASKRLLPTLPGRLGAADVDLVHAADQLFALANPRLQHDVQQLLNSLEDLTWLNLRFRPFSALAPDAQTDYLESWQNSPLGLQRQAFSALSKIVCTLFYMTPESWPQIGYDGPWIGRYDFGQGLDNQGALSANPNPYVFERFAP